MPELAEKINDIGRAFDEFKKSNDERLAQIEKNGRADPELEAKIDRISKDITSMQADKERLDSIEAKVNRVQFGGGGGDDKNAKAKSEHKDAFNGYFRKGAAGNLRELEVQAALTTQVDEDGGFIVPEDVDTEISRVLGTMSAMRSLARVVPVGSATFKRLHNVGGTTSGWVGEEESREETSTPKFKALEFPTMELFAQPGITQNMLDDGYLDVAAWLADEVSIEFSEKEGAAFITGNGIKKPRGILSYTNKANGQQKFGELGFVASGASGAFAASNPSDKLIDLVHALRRGYRMNANWLMNDLTLAAVRKLKDADGNYLWRAGIEAGESETLLGKPVEIDDNMPDIAANSLAMAFGDFRRGYIITDRFGTRILRDEFTNKPYIMFYTTKRVGGGLNDSEAIKLMKFSA